jgi:predicted enzyme related to lactoylglutathione lyase
MRASPTLIEFPADDAQRARAFWSGLIGAELQPRADAQGEGWQSRRRDDATASVGVHTRGRGPGDTFSLPYFELDDMQAALAQVPSLGGSVVHAGERWSICKDSEGNPFGLALRTDDAPQPVLEQG